MNQLRMQFPSTLDISIRPLDTTASSTSSYDQPPTQTARPSSVLGVDPVMSVSQNSGAAGKGVLIGMLSAFGSALFIALVFGLIYFLRNTSKGRILLDRIGRPGEFDDEQAFAREEEEALETMDDIQRAEYLRAKAYVSANPPESADTDISLSQFLAIQEKGVSAWEFEPELEIANCFVEGRTEIEFYDTECCVQSNLPIPKQNEVYYWEAKIYDKPETTNVAIGLTTKPYPLFRLPGFHKTSVSYTSSGQRRFNQPFSGAPSYGPAYVRGDVVGCGYRPRTGTVFFTRNGKKLEDVTSTLKTQNLFPTVGANGPCSIHVNFGQMGFVFIEANVKKWGLAPMTGSLAPPPPYGSEAGSILLEGGHHGVQEGQGYLSASAAFGSWAGGRSHGRSRSATLRLGRAHPTSPGPQRSPTDISLTQLSFAESGREGGAVDEAASDDSDQDDAGEGSSSATPQPPANVLPTEISTTGTPVYNGLGIDAPPPDYESPERSSSEAGSTPRAGSAELSRDSTEADESARLLPPRTSSRQVRSAEPPSPPIPSYDAAVGRSEARENSAS